MTKTNLLATLALGLLLGTATPAFATPVFNRIASFPVALNAPDAEATSSEIITATDDGMTLIYSDSPNGGIGFVPFGLDRMPDLDIVIPRPEITLHRPSVILHST